MVADMVADIVVVMFPFCQFLRVITKRRDNIVADMEVDMVADKVTDMEVDMVADMEEDMVADMVADMEVDMMADIVATIFFLSRTSFTPKFFELKLTPSCASSKICELSLLLLLCLFFPLNSLFSFCQDCHLHLDPLVSLSTWGDPSLSFVCLLMISKETFRWTSCSDPPLSCSSPSSSQSTWTSSSSRSTSPPSLIKVATHIIVIPFVIIAIENSTLNIIFFITTFVRKSQSSGV